MRTGKALELLFSPKVQLLLGILEEDSLGPAVLQLEQCGAQHRHPEQVSGLWPGDTGLYLGCSNYTAQLLLVTTVPWMMSRRFNSCVAANTASAPKDFKNYEPHTVLWQSVLLSALVYAEWVPGAELLAPFTGIHFTSETQRKLKSQEKMRKNKISAHLI